MDDLPPEDRPEVGPPPDSTGTLIERLRQGDSESRNELFARYLPRLKRWAHGRVPKGGPGVPDTDDLVQLTFIRALSHVETFEHRHDGAFLAYLMRILLNQIRDEARRIQRAPRQTHLDGALPDPTPSPLEQAMGREMFEKYHEALLRLAPDQREAVVLRIELGLTYQEVAKELGRPTATAARMLIQRALARLARDMHEHQ